jgi:hypothetical protein
MIIVLLKTPEGLSLGNHIATSKSSVPESREILLMRFRITTTKGVTWRHQLIPQM